AVQGSLFGVTLRMWAIAAASAASFSCSAAVSMRSVIAHPLRDHARTVQSGQRGVEMLLGITLAGPLMRHGDAARQDHPQHGTAAHLDRDRRVIAPADAVEDRAVDGVLGAVLG